MKKPLSLIFSMSLLACLSFTTGCSDDDEAQPDPREERLDLLAGQESKAWKIFSLHMNGANVTSFLEECNVDDHYVLYRDGKGEVLGMEDKCVDNEPSTLASGSWELDEDLETMSLNLPPLMMENVEILELTEERLQLRKVEDQETIMVTYQAAE